jgi:hypothetical protein
MSGRDCPAGALSTVGWKVQFRIERRDPEMSGA